MWYKAEVATQLPEKLADENTFITYNYIKFVNNLPNSVILIVFTNLLEKILICHSTF